MPRDEFERLERRWRERPLFLERPSDKPRWLLVAVLLALGLLLGMAAIEPSAPGRLLDRFTGTPGDAPGDQAARANPAGLRIPAVPAAR